MAAKQRKRRLVQRLLGALLFLMGMAGAGITAWDLKQTTEFSTEKRQERADEIADSYRIDYGGGYGEESVGSVPSSRQVAKDTRYLTKELSRAKKASFLIPVLRSYTYDDLVRSRRNLLRHGKKAVGKKRFKKGKPSTRTAKKLAKNADFVEAMRDGGQALERFHWSIPNVPLAYTILFSLMAFGGLLATIYFGKTGALIVGVGLFAPAYWYDFTSEAIFHVPFALIAIVLFFVTPWPWGGKDDGSPQHQSQLSGRQLAFRQLLAGTGVLVFSIAITVGSIALAEEFGAASAPVAIGGAIWGLIFIARGFIGLLRG